MNNAFFPDRPATAAARQPSGHQREQRLQQLELAIRARNDHNNLMHWLDEYLDLGLELAADAAANGRPALQESWLRRVYSHLRNTAFCDQCSSLCRQQCLECLYQPYFALRHFYQQQPDGQLPMRRLSQDLSSVARFVI